MAMVRADPSVVSTRFANSVLHSIPIDSLYATTDIDKERSIYSYRAVRILCTQS